MKNIGLSKLAAMILAFSVASMALAGCAAAAAPAEQTAAEAETAVESAPAAEAEEATAVESAPAEEEAPVEADEEAAAEEWDGEITDINILLYDLRGCGDNAQPIIDAMNEITEKTVGVHANITWAQTATFSQTATMAIAGGEQLDVLSIIPVDPVSFTALIANEQVMDISDIIAEEAPELLETVGEYMEGMSVNGHIYGVPCYRNYSSAQYLIMRGDVLEDLGMMDAANNAESWADIEKIFDAVKENTSLSPLFGSVYSYGQFYNRDELHNGDAWDVLGDAMNLIYTDSEGNITLLPEEPRFKEAIDWQKEYFDAGYIYKDSATTEDHQDTVTKAGVVFSTIQNGELGVEVNKQEATGYPEVCIELGKNILGSAKVNKFGVCVPVTAQEPEAAVRWISAITTDPRLENLIVWGIEGEDYIVKDDEADFPEGVTAENVRYHSTDFMYGNQFLCLPWAGQGADFRQVSYDYLKDSPISPYMGFVFDQSDMTNTVTALSSVYQKYYKTLVYGVFAEDTLDNYIADLKTAGVDEYISSIQEQLDAFMAAK